MALVLPNPGSATLNLSAIDDGLPKRDGKTVGMTVTWAKYRGPGPIVFKEISTKLTDGKAATIANFSEPGEYVLQAVVDDGSARLPAISATTAGWCPESVWVLVAASEAKFSTFDSRHPHLCCLRSKLKDSLSN